MDTPCIILIVVMCVVAACEAGVALVMLRAKRKKRESALDDERVAEIAKRKTALEILRSGEKNDYEHSQLYTFNDNKLEDNPLAEWERYRSRISGNFIPLDLDYIGVKKRELISLIGKYEKIEYARHKLKIIRDNIKNPYRDWDYDEQDFHKALAALDLKPEFFGTSIEELAELRKNFMKLKAEKLLQLTRDNIKTALANYEAMIAALTESGYIRKDIGLTLEDDELFASVKKYGEALTKAEEPPKTQT